LKLIGLLIIFIVAFLFSLLGDGRARIYFPPAVTDNSKIPHQTGKVAIVTGANTGIGYETCLELIKKGATCIATARTQNKADETATKLNSLKLKGKAIGMELQLDDHNSIFQFAQNFRAKKLSIHLLILNAGVMAIPKYEETKDGLEMHTGVNFIGHYYLNKLLQDIVEASQPSRVICVTSAAHMMVTQALPSYSLIKGKDIAKPENYYRWWQYGVSKLFNIYHAKELNERMQQEKKDVIAIAVHPGGVVTELGRHITSYVYNEMLQKAMSLLQLTPNEGAITQLYAATAPNATGLAGQYMVPIARVINSNPISYDVKTRKRIIQEAEEIIKNWP